MADLEINDFLIGRTSIYEYFFSAYYKAFTKELLPFTNAFVNTISQLAENTDIPPLAKATKNLRRFEELSHGMQDAELVEKLNACYSKLYITSENIKMTEHSYRESEMSRQTIILNIIDFFANNNIIKPTEINLPSDSLAMELFFIFRMSDKLAKQNDNIKHIIEQQVSFLNDHLSLWCDKFANATNERCDNDSLYVFYAGLAEACQGFLMYDIRLLNQIYNRMVDSDV